VAARLVAIYNCPRVNYALVGELVEVANEGPIAEVPVLQLLTISVLLAVAVHRRPHTLASAAQVTYCAHLAIVATAVSRRMFTPSLRRTNILRARIVIITNHRCPDANSALAVIGN
jgi:hypothetical protein